MSPPLRHAAVEQNGKKGLVLRRIDEDDRRIVRIFLTDEGKSG